MEDEAFFGAGDERPRAAVPAFDAVAGRGVLLVFASDGAAFAGAIDIATTIGATRIGRVKRLLDLILG